MSNLQPVRGTHDLMFDDIRRHRVIEEKAFEIASRYGYGEIATPMDTDIAVFETTDLQAYTFLIDGLRDTAFFSEPYFDVVDIVPAVEDGYRDYDRAQGVQAA